jgi:hypothetical protein
MSLEALRRVYLAAPEAGRREALELALSPNRFFVKQDLSIGLCETEMARAARLLCELLEAASRFELIDDPFSKEVLEVLMCQTIGPKVHHTLTTQWSVVDNRVSYRVQLAGTLDKCMATLSERIEEETARMGEDPAGKALMAMRYVAKYPGPELLQNNFHCHIPGLQNKDLAAMLRWLIDMELSTIEQMCHLVHQPLYSSLPKFWTNIYKNLLHRLCKLADADFHAAVRAALGARAADYTQGPLKTLTRMKVKELEYGEVGPDSHAARTTAAHIVDINRGAVLVHTAADLLDLMREVESWTLETHGLRPVRLKNGFSSEMSLHYRDVKFIFEFRVQGRPWTLLGELQVMLPQWELLKKAMHTLYRLMRGDYDHVSSRAMWMAWAALCLARGVDRSTRLPRDDVLTHLWPREQIADQAKPPGGLLWGYREFHDYVSALPVLRQRDLLEQLVDTYIRD